MGSCRGIQATQGCTSESSAVGMVWVAVLNSANEYRAIVEGNSADAVSERAQNANGGL